LPAQTLNFTLDEYAMRLDKTRRQMAKRGIDTLVVIDPSNMNWLSGYDGWSFYTHQCVVVPLEGEIFWFGRHMDAAGAVRTVYLPDSQVLSYPDHYVQNPDLHPMSLLAQIMTDRGLGGGTIGIEMDNYYVTAAAFHAMKAGLPNAGFSDATLLVNWLRGEKSATELDFMRKAGRIVEAVHRAILDVADVGVPKNMVAAEIYRASHKGVEGAGGDYSAVVPLMASGPAASAPHLTWDETPLKAGEGTFFEVAGCYRRYHTPTSRTLFLGKPNQAFLDAEKATLEGLEAGLEAARPGNKCEDIAKAYFAVLAKYGIHKDSRTGYGVGISYQPDWGERTASLRVGDRTELKPGMTFHFMTGLWLEDMGLEITETLAITETGYETLSNVPRQLFVK
jgi:ectoine hydrolase